MTQAFPKPTRATKDDLPQAIRAYYDWVAQRGCIVPGCDRPATLHHVRGVRSTKTGRALPRRKSHARAAVVPICKKHHQDDKFAIQTIGEEAFGVHHLGGSTAVLEWALTYALRYVTEAL